MADQILDKTWTVIALISTIRIFRRTLISALSSRCPFLQTSTWLINQQWLSRNQIRTRNLFGILSRNIPWINTKRTSLWQVWGTSKPGKLSVKPSTLNVNNSNCKEISHFKNDKEKVWTWNRKFKTISNGWNNKNYKRSLRLKSLTNPIKLKWQRMRIKEWLNNRKLCRSRSLWKEGYRSIGARRDSVKKGVSNYWWSTQNIINSNTSLRIRDQPNTRNKTQSWAIVNARKKTRISKASTFVSRDTKLSCNACLTCNKETLIKLKTVRSKPWP